TTALYVLPVVQHRLALDEPAVAAVGEADQLRRAVAVFLRHVLAPTLGWRLDVAVTGDHLIRASHRSPLSPRLSAPTYRSVWRSCHGDARSCAVQKPGWGSCR